ncbi:MAG: hypothetical protein PHV33_07400 [Elusimicrobiales bacterium]|nr:hypothetical protein [Elusimicrobiales bacterium]
MTVKLKFFLPVIAALPALYGALAAKDLAELQSAKESRVLEQALRFYSNGMDTEAMDRFMEIIVRGSPSEKALATEYISKINMRLNYGLRPSANAGRSSDMDGGRAGSEFPPVTKSLEAEVSPYAARGEIPPAERELLNEKIQTKIDQLRSELLWKLGETNGVKVYAGDGGVKAMALDPQFLFADMGKAELRHDAASVLDSLAGLIFTAGNANCLVLPEGTALEDVHLGGIRRAMAVYSYLESRGLSSARLEVSLTGTGVRLPKEVMDTSGMVVLFDYFKQPKLKTPEDNRVKGPKVTLGVYPGKMQTKSNEGAIVEFSVLEGRGGRPDWKFEIFGVLKDGTRLPLREISGSGARFSHTYWNGRRKFFGAAYPAGNYVFKLTAVDLDGNEASVSRKLLLTPPR